jgi:NO-binding membrane sensor protein with MHYT domain
MPRPGARFSVGPRPADPPGAAREAAPGERHAAGRTVASVAIGGTGIWVTHVVAMLGYTIPAQQILYNVPMTVISLGAITVAAAGFETGG